MGGASAGTRFAFAASGNQEDFGVLKITWLTRKCRGATLKLEGELRGPWVEEVRNAWAQRAPRSPCLDLDLCAVTFVDAAGAQFLRDLVGQGTSVAACSSFIAELLQLEEP